jgi:hypothetical protein
MYVDQRRHPQAPPTAPPGRGPSLTAAGAVLVLAGVAGVAGVIDVVAGDSLRLVFSAGLVLGALIAALLVRRRDILTVVFAPPLVFLAGSLVAMLLGRGEGGGGIIDLAASWLVYGFPAMALATGVAGIVALVRRGRR